MKRKFTKYPQGYVKASRSMGDIRPGVAVKTIDGDVVYVTQILDDKWVWVTPDAKDRDNPAAYGNSLPIDWIVKVFRR